MVSASLSYIDRDDKGNLNGFYLEPLKPENMMSKVSLIFFTLLLCVCGIVSTAFGQDNWLGGAGLWSDHSKWSAGVPMSTSNAYIDHGKSGASPVMLNYNGAQCANLTIDVYIPYRKAYLTGLNPAFLRHVLHHLENSRP